MLVTLSDKKMLMKVALGTSAQQLNDIVGSEIEVKDVIQFETTREETGETAVNTSLIDTKNKIYSTLSPTVAKSIIIISNFHDFKDGPIKVKVINQKNPKTKRDFLTLDVV